MLKEARNHLSRVMVTESSEFYSSFQSRVQKFSGQLRKKPLYYWNYVQVRTGKDFNSTESKIPGVDVFIYFDIRGTARLQTEMMA